MEQLKGPEAGTFMTKHVYDMNKKTEELHDFAYGLLPDSNDAENSFQTRKNQYQPFLYPT